ncbi:MAG TPA: hypothetical protein VIF82_06430 [Burkholderiaceae bacterium]|jgi:hypothetical protein
MAPSKNNQRKYAICFWVGLQLMCFALFLHPMSPENFLLLAITDPLETISEQYGFGMAIGFWISLSLLLVGLFGWIDIAHFFKNIRRTNPHSSPKFRQAR